MCMMIKDKYIDPFTDFGFKWLFGTEQNKDLLISFLNDLLEIEHKIIDVEYRNLEKLGLNIIDRKAIFDIYCTDEKKNNFIVELQRSKQKYFKDRSVYYTSFPIQEQSKKGDWDYQLKKIFFVGILEFEMKDNSKNEDYLTKVQLFDMDKKEVFYDKLIYYYVEMPKFKKSEAELKNHLEYWLYTLNNMADLKEIPQKLKEDKLIHKAFDVAEFLALSKDEQFAYQIDLKSRLDYKNAFDYAKEMAEAKGKAKGKAEGIVEGEKQKTIEIVKNSLSLRLDVETISKLTGLSVEEIKNLG